MKKRIFSLILTLAMVLSLFSGLSIPARAEGNYQKATSIAVGDTVVLVCEGVTKELSGISSTSTHYGLAADYSGSPAGTMAFTVVEGSASGTFGFKNGDNYLCWSSGNSLDVSSTLNANSSWTVTFDSSGNAAIVNAADSARQIWWNVSSPRFACYTGKTAGSGYYATQLYKLAAAGDCTHENATYVDDPLPTCTEAGTRNFTCPDCGATWTSTIPALGHAWDAGTVTTEPTCTQAGVKTFTCTRDNCDATKTEAVPATGHVDENEDGLCDVCGAQMLTGSFVLADSIAADDQIIFVYPGSDTVDPYAVGALSGTYLPAVETTIADGVCTAPAALVFTVEAGTAEGSFAFKTDDGKYLTASDAASGSNNVYLTATVASADTDWTVAIANGLAAVSYNSSKAETGRFLRANTGTTPKRITAYVGPTNQKDIAIYKYVENTPEPPTPSDDIDVYVIDKTNAGEVKIWAWGSDGNLNGLVWETRPAMSSEGTAYADVESNPVGFTYYKYTLDKSKYGTGVIFTTGAGQTAAKDYVTDAGTTGRVVYYLTGENDGNGNALSAFPSDKLWIVKEAHEATCTAGAYTTYVNLFNENDTANSPAGDPLGHDWGEPTYTWAADHSTCTAHAVCSRDSSHTLHEVAQGDAVTSVTTEEGTTYTATFENSYFEDQTDFVAAAVIGDVFFEKVETSADLEAGIYLIVYELTDSSGIAFNGGLGTLDANNNGISVAISEKKIPADGTTMAAVFTIEAMDGGYSIKSASGYYIGRTDDTNGMLASADTAYTHTISINADGSAQIVSEGSAVLRYNKTSGQERFRYFRSGTYTNQQPVALYKLVDNTHVHDVQLVAAVQPTCENTGFAAYYHCVAEDCPLAGKKFADEELTQEKTDEELTLAALGHDYQNPTYAWTETEDGWSCTGTAVCSRDEAHVLTETKAATYEVTTPATYEAAGSGLWTATFENEVFEPQTKEVEIPQLEARWIDVYVIDGTNSDVLNYHVWAGMGTEAVSKAPWPGEAMELIDESPDKDGLPVYKVSINFAEWNSGLLFNNYVNGSGSQTADLNLAQLVGENTQYVIYKINSDWTVTNPADIYPASSLEEVAPTCTEAGSKTWKGLLKHEDLVETIPALDHNMTAHEAVAATCTEAGSSAYWSCDRCGKFFSDENGENEIQENSWIIEASGHNMTAHEATAATCTEDGNTAYWSCDRCGKFFSDENGENEIQENSWIIEATGHDWGTPTYEWAADNSTVTATRVCAKDDTHIETETVNTVYTVTTEPTYEAAGVGKYTATFTNPAFAEQTKEVEIPQLVARTVDVYVIDGTGSEALNYHVWKVVDGTDVPKHNWPGEAMELIPESPDKDGLPVYKVSINIAEWNAGLIFNNGTGQTANLDLMELVDENTQYVIYKLASDWTVTNPDDIYPASSLEEVAPTCTEAGSKTWKGLLKHEDLVETIPATGGHDWQAPVWHVAEDGTLTKVTHCSKCGETQVEETFARKLFASITDPTGVEVSGSAFDNYFATLVIPANATVNSAFATILLEMTDVAGLGIVGTRSYSMTIQTGTDKNVALETYFADLFALNALTVQGEIDGNPYSYELTRDVDKDEGKDYHAYLMTTDTAETRTAWQALTAALTSTTQANDDSYVLIKHGSYVQIGTEKLEFEREGDLRLDNIHDTEGLMAEIRAALKLSTGVDAAETPIEIFLTAGTTLALGNSVLTLDRDAKITVAGVDLSGILSELQGKSSAAEMLKTIVTRVYGTLADLNGSTLTVNVEFSDPVPPEVEDDTLVFRTISLTLGEEILPSYTFYGRLVKNYSRVTVEMTMKDTGEVIVVEQADMTNLYNGGAYIAMFRNIKAKEMWKEFSVRIVCYDADGVRHVGPADEHSVKTLALEILEEKDENYNPKGKKLAADMLNYGAAAQLAFNENVDHLVNMQEDNETKLELVDKYETKETPAATATVSHSGNGVELISSATLGNRVMLTVTGTFDNSDPVFLYVKNLDTGVEYDPIETESAGANTQTSRYAWRGYFDHVGAKNMRSMMEVTMRDASGNVVSETMTWSVEAMVNESVNSAGTSQVMKDVLIAMLKYGDSAADYLKGTNNGN